MSAKDQLKQKFSSDPDKYYRVKLFDEMDFIRKKCTKCKAFFWTLDADRTHCPNPPCESYGFIGEPLDASLDYIKTWQKIEQFFVKNGHASIPSYPVVCRWFPGLYFTVASIVAFQRAAGNKTVFEMPANPLVIPQSCMRFNDIPNVGVTGRHFTNFTMIGQHSIFDEKGDGYWKDKCIELDFRLLTHVFKIDPKDINFIEDVWVGPNAFGYSLEYYYKGLELGNAVFTEFVGTPENHRPMEKKVIDMGAGLERFAWVAQGTPTAYEAVFGPVADKLLQHVNYDKNFWAQYARVSGNFNMEDFKNYRSAKEKAANMMGIGTNKLIETTAPIEAIFAILDHSRSLLLAVGDGGLPSNVGGGYNLRVILRRALGFIDEFGFDIDLYDVCKMHAKYLKDFNPRVKLGLEGLEDILNVEKERFKVSRSRGEQMVSSAVKKGNLTTDKLVELYESHGITPEIIEKIAQKENIEIEIPTNFYDIISSRHMKEKQQEGLKINLEGLPPTRLLFYEDQSKQEFTAKVLKVIENRYVILDQTAFYGRAGGQHGDTGTLNGCPVFETQKHGNIIVHFVDAPSFSEGDVVHGKIEWAKRQQLMKHHTAVHVIHGAAHKILGNHVWQAGADKSVEKAHLDITHYKPISPEEMGKIETLANEIVKSNRKINKYVLPRTEAEQRFGFTIYQGGAIPHKDLRIIEIPDFDVEACSGTHCDNTGEMDPIRIISAERIQDGIIRLSLVSGEAALKFESEQRKIYVETKRLLDANDDNLVEKAGLLFAQWKGLKKKLEKSVHDSSDLLVSDLEKKFVNNVLIAHVMGDMKKLQAISKKLSNDDRIILLFGTADELYVFGSAGRNTSIDIGKIVKEACVIVGGSGGGSRYVAQGMGTYKHSVDEAMRDAESKLL